MKKVISILVIVVIFIAVTSCSPGLIKKESYLNEEYLLKMSERWQNDIEMGNEHSSVRIFQSYLGPYTEEAKARFYKEKNDLNKVFGTAEKSYVLRYFHIIHKDVLFIQIFQIELSKKIE